MFRLVVDHRLKHYVVCLQCKVTIVLTRTQDEGHVQGLSVQDLNQELDCQAEGNDQGLKVQCQDKELDFSGEGKGQGLNNQD